METQLQTNRQVHKMQSILETLNNGRKMGDSITGGRWLNAHEDRSAGVKIFSSRCLLLCDTSNTGDFGLVIAEPRIHTPEEIQRPNSGGSVSITGRLRVYRGAASLCSERPLKGPPSGLVAFYSDDLEPRIPAVAVSVGTDILIYKNNKPFFKWSTPPVPCTALEEEIWRKLISPEGLEKDSLKEHLSSLKTIAFIDLSPRSQKLLIIASDKNKDGFQPIEEFIGRYLHADLPTRPAVITSLAILNKNSLNIGSIACLVVATENGHIYILDPVAFTVLHQASSSTQTNQAPTHITCSGQFDIDYRIITVCRDGSVWLLRRGWLEGRRLLAATLGGPIIECVMLGPENMIVIAGKEKIGVWSRKGKLLYSIQPGNKQSTISCLSLVSLPHLNTCLLAVGINTQIQFYQNRTLVDIVQLPDKPSAIKFGRLGQEDNVLIITTKDGSLLFKILKRTAEFSSSPNNSETPNLSVVNRPLPLPKRSKLFAEQALRERNHALSIHQNFQQGLIRLRLIAANKTVLALNTADQSVSDNAKHPVKLAAQVSINWRNKYLELTYAGFTIFYGRLGLFAVRTHKLFELEGNNFRVLGLGPKFTLTLTLENLSSDKSVTDLSVLLHANIAKYKIEQPFVPVPMIPPELYYKVETSVTEIIDSTSLENNDESSVPIRVFVLISGQAQPILAASINMPPTDPLAFLV